MLKIEFEGTDGAGKTTGLKYFIAKALDSGLNVVETREVGNPHLPICAKLRELVLDPASNLAGESMELIFSAMRKENDVWLEKLQNGSHVPDLVVSDRGWFSHLAYTDHNVNSQFTDRLYYGVMKKITKMPDIVIYFNVDTQTALKRRQSRGSGMDVIEMKGVGYQEAVRSSFAEYLDGETGVLLYNVDANQDVQGVQQQLNIILADIKQKHF